MINALGIAPASAPLPAHPPAAAAATDDQNPARSFARLLDQAASRGADGGALAPTAPSAAAGASPGSPGSPAAPAAPGPTDREPRPDDAADGPATSAADASAARLANRKLHPTQAGERKAPARATARGEADPASAVGGAESASANTTLAADEAVSRPGGGAQSKTAAQGADEAALALALQPSSNLLPGVAAKQTAAGSRAAQTALAASAGRAAAAADGASEAGALRQPAADASAAAAARLAPDGSAFADALARSAPGAQPGTEGRQDTSLTQPTPTVAAAPTSTAPAATAEAALAARPGSDAFASQLGARITTFVRDGVEHARLHLHPAELGPVSVQIQIDGMQAQVHLAAENPLTRHALEQAMPQLAGSLREAGLTLAGGGVFEQARQGGEAPAGDTGGRGQRGNADADNTAVAADPRPAATPSRARRGVVDLVA